MRNSATAAAVPHRAVLRQRRNRSKYLKRPTGAADSGKLTKRIVTEILPQGEFYPAEDYHQVTTARIHFATITNPHPAADVTSAWKKLWG